MMSFPNSSNDLFLFGNISKDIIKTPDREYSMAGGAILHAAWVAKQLGMNYSILTKCRKSDRYMLSEFPDKEKVIWSESSATTSIHNYYQTQSKETRVCTNLSSADPYRMDDFGILDTEVIEYCGLIQGEIDYNLIRQLASKAKLAIDAQGLLRKVFPGGKMEFADISYIDKIYPLLEFFKADAAEAEFLTGIDTKTQEGRELTAMEFHKMGVKEVLITHNENLTVFTGDSPILVPFRNDSLLGRTGRGDTCFCSYISRRFHYDPKDSSLFAAALTSMKMEIPGPFKKTENEVKDFIQNRYPEF